MRQLRFYLIRPIINHRSGFVTVYPSLSASDRSRILRIDRTSPDVIKSRDPHRGSTTRHQKRSIEIRDADSPGTSETQPVAREEKKTRETRPISSLSLLPLHSHGAFTLFWTPIGPYLSRQFGRDENGFYPGNARARCTWGCHCRIDEIHVVVWEFPRVPPYTIKVVPASGWRVDTNL